MKGHAERQPDTSHEYFAGQAMVALIGLAEKGELRALATDDTVADTVARLSCAYADAMVAKLDKIRNVGLRAAVRAIEGLDE